MRHLLLLLSLVLIGCGSTETFIQDRTFTAVSPQIRDTVVVTRADTVVVEGVKVVKTDTVIQVQYFPVTKKFYVRVDPDTVRITFRDTTTIHTTVIQKTPFLSKLGLVAIGFLVCIGLAIFGYVRGLIKV